MHEPRTGVEIVSALEPQSRELAGYFAFLPEATFLAGDERHWGPAHVLAHLTDTHMLIARGFRNGTALPAHDTGRSRSRAELAAALDAAIVAEADRLRRANPVPPARAAGATRPALLAAYADEARSLREAVPAWSEPELDARAMRHPLLGTITAREMLLFVLVHDRHHLNGVRRKLSTRNG